MGSSDDNADQYLAAARSLPRPTSEQVAAFVDYVSSGHSWYKHLPFFAPGDPFVVFLDPHAGFDRLVLEDGRVTHRRRTEETPQRQRFHYTWQPTADYLMAYGHLNYHHGSGTSFEVAQADGVLVTASSLTVQAQTGEWIAVPEEVQLAGTARLTCHLHPFGDTTWPLVEMAGYGVVNWAGIVGTVRLARRYGWLPIHALFDSVRARKVPIEAILSAVHDFVEAVDPGFGANEASRRMLEGQVRAWIADVRRGDRHGPHPQWVREEWYEVAHELDLGRLGQAVANVLDYIYGVASDDRWGDD